MNEADISRRVTELTREIGTLSDELISRSAQRRSYVRLLITKYGWSQHDVARLLGISQPAVSNFLRGGVKLSEKDA